MEIQRDVEHGVNGESAPSLAVVVSKLVHSHFMLMSLMMDCAVTILVNMVTEKNNHDYAKQKYHAQLIVSEVGAISPIALPLVVVEPKNACTPSPGKLLMVAKNALMNAAQRTSLTAAQKSAWSIARATFWSGPNVSELERTHSVMTPESARRQAVSLAASTLRRQPLLVAAQTNACQTRPGTVNCLVAQLIAKVPGANGASVKAQSFMR